LEELFDGFDMAAIRQEQDQMIVGLHRGVVMRDDDILAAHHGAQGRALRQRDVLDARPMTFELSASPCTTTSSASAAPRRSECTRTTSPRRTCASNDPMVTVCGEMATSIEPLSMSSA
jgi:hypothetical protein